MRLAVVLTMALLTGESLASAQSAPRPSSSSSASPSSSAAPAPAHPPAASSPTKAATPTELRSSPPSDDVRQDIEEAKQLRVDRDYGGALLKFTRAQEKSHDASLLLEMADCEKSLQHFARAARLVDKALQGASGSLTPAQTGQAHDLSNSLQPSLGRVRVKVDPPGATVRVDEDVAGQSPLEEYVVVDAGARHLRISKPGFIEQTTTLNISGGSERTIEIKLEQDVQKGRVRVHTSAKNAVELDGVVAYGNWDGLVSPGPHALRVEAPGVSAFETTLNVVPNQTRTLNVTLGIHDVTPIWLWIAGGLVLSATGVVAGVAVFH